MELIQFKDIVDSMLPNGFQSGITSGRFKNESAVFVKNGNKQNAIRFPRNGLIWDDIEIIKRIVRSLIESVK